MNLVNERSTALADVAAVLLDALHDRHVDDWATVSTPPGVIIEELIEGAVGGDGPTTPNELNAIHILVSCSAASGSMCVSGNLQEVNWQKYLNRLCAATISHQEVVDSIMEVLGLVDPEAAYACQPGFITTMLALEGTNNGVLGCLLNSSSQLLSLNGLIKVQLPLLKFLRACQA